MLALGSNQRLRALLEYQSVGFWDVDYRILTTVPDFSRRTRAFAFGALVIDLNHRTIVCHRTIFTAATKQTLRSSGTLVKT